MRCDEVHPLLVALRDGELAPAQVTFVERHLDVCAACRALDEAGLSAVMIGDPGFYQRFFGFVSGPASWWTLPGPVEPERILLRAGEAVRWPAHGALGPDVLRSRA